jgi:hypothetical protein
MAAFWAQARKLDLPQDLLLSTLCGLARGNRRKDDPPPPEEGGKHPGDAS